MRCRFCSYCRFVNAHYQLVPYLLTTGSEAFEGDNSSITPLAPHQNFIEKVNHNIIEWYMAICIHTCTGDCRSLAM